MENSLDLRQIIGILRKHLLFIIISAFGLMIIAFSVSEFVLTPKYTSTTQLLVNRKSDSDAAGTEYQDQQADVQMISTYKDIITNEVILKQVKHNLASPERVIRKAQKAVYRRSSTTGKKKLVRAARPALIESTGNSYNVSVTDLKNSISISNQQNSQVFALSVESTDPQEAAAIANETADIFRSKIKSIMSVNNVTIVSKATANDNKTFPKTRYITLFGLLLGVLVGISYSFVKELTDTTIKDDEFLTNELKLTNLGHIAEIRRINGSHLTIKRHGDHLKPNHRRV